MDASAVVLALSGHSRGHTTVLSGVFFHSSNLTVLDNGQSFRNLSATHYNDTKRERTLPCGACERRRG